MAVDKDAIAEEFKLIRRAFGLNDWAIRLGYDTEEPNIAECGASAYMEADINVVAERVRDAKHLRRLMIHEFSHALLHELTSIAEYLAETIGGEPTKKIIADAEHRTIAKIEKMPIWRSLE